MPRTQQHTIQSVNAAPVLLLIAQLVKRRNVNAAPPLPSPSTPLLCFLSGVLYGFPHLTAWGHGQNEVASLPGVLPLTEQHPE